MKINVLPRTIANMIAAGEVVERPASVVKELMENSVDAGAAAITVEIQKGGMSYIRITDDGCGIEPDQVETAFLRHATSKIKTEEDLSAIYTLGFRGEALASIAAVARVDIFTKTKDNRFGRCVSIEGGEIIESDDAGCSNGTTLIVRDLFFNTPARMKFLKNDATETGYITDTVNKMILSHPEIKIKLIVNGKMTVNSGGDGRLLGAIRTVYGKDYINHMQQVVYSEDGIEVAGYVGTGDIARKDRRQQVFFINGRYISSKVISAALSEAFQNTVMIGKYPVAVLMLKVNGNFVDVNVHPTKTEVRFSDDKKVYHSVFWAVKNALSVKKYVPEVQMSSDSKRKIIMKAKEDAAKEQNRASQLDINLLRDAFFRQKTESESLDGQKSAPSVKKENVALPENTNIAFADTPPAAAASHPEENTPPDADVPDHIAANVFFSKEDLSFFKSDDSAGYQSDPDIIQAKEPMKDITAKFFPGKQDVQEHPGAHYEKAGDDARNIKDVCDKSEHPAQISCKAGIDFVLIGQVFATYILIQKENEMLIIDQHAAHERLYFEQLLEEYRTKSISSQRLLLPAVVSFEPAIFPLVCENFDFFADLGFECEEFGDCAIVVRAAPAAVTDGDIEGAVTELANLLERGYTDARKTVLEDALHTIACKRALKGNSVLDRREMETLCEKVLSFDYINTCPHGRPICISMTKYEMEKQFKRKV